MIIKPANRYPADPRAVFILALSVFSGLTALALETAPGSLESVLPSWAVTIWGALLSLGSLLTLAGMARQTANGIITEQVGSVMVGVTTIYYSIIALLIVGTEAVQTVGIVLAWGAACLLRWAQLQVSINQAAAEARHRQIQRGIKRGVQAEIERREGLQ